jgi:hypothetical protein
VSRQRPFQAGDVIRWNPPFDAYPAASLQAGVKGMSGVIQPHDPGSNDILPVKVGFQTLLLNTQYMELLP